MKLNYKRTLLIGFAVKVGRDTAWNEEQSLVGVKAFNVNVEGKERLLIVHELVLIEFVELFLLDVVDGLFP